jgi:hypothetical protein
VTASNLGKELEKLSDSCVESKWAAGRCETWGGLGGSLDRGPIFLDSKLMIDKLWEPFCDGIIFF